MEPPHHGSFTRHQDVGWGHHTRPSTGRRTHHGCLHHGCCRQWIVRRCVLLQKVSRRFSCEPTCRIVDMQWSVDLICMALSEIRVFSIYSESILTCLCTSTHVICDMRALNSHHTMNTPCQLLCHSCIHYAHTMQLSHTLSPARMPHDNFFHHAVIS